MFKKILIANRGEVAIRINRAAHDLGIKTVAVYSQADKDSLHVKAADEAVCIGGPLPKDSYLNIPAIISAAEITDVEAIHPGYGFLAENAHFAEVCESCEIKFIGPSADSIRRMGDKMAARETVKKAGVPLVPGSFDRIRDKEEALKLAKQFKYPVILKASAGGGGKGMRVCHNDVRLVSALMTAEREAEAAFGNSAVYIEKYFEKSRHVEIQVLGDRHGNLIHLNERDCSIQRRHQKLLEESPSPALDPKLRRKMGEVAVKAAQAAPCEGRGLPEQFRGVGGSDPHVFRARRAGRPDRHRGRGRSDGEPLLRFDGLEADGPRQGPGRRDQDHDARARRVRRGTDQDDDPAPPRDRPEPDLQARRLLHGFHSETVRKVPQRTTLTFR